VLLELYIRERGEFVEIFHIPTTELVADVHAKALPPNALGTAKKPFVFVRPRKFV
jgi:hypothetical protein